MLVIFSFEYFVTKYLMNVEDLIIGTVAQKGIDGSEPGTQERLCMHPGKPLNEFSGKTLFKLEFD
jgi:hypothetical protein